MVIGIIIIMIIVFVGSFLIDKMVNTKEITIINNTEQTIKELLLEEVTESSTDSWVMPLDRKELRVKRVNIDIPNGEKATLRIEDKLYNILIRDTNESLYRFNFKDLGNAKEITFTSLHRVCNL